MSKSYTVMELEAIKYLCKCVNSVASLPADLIADTNVATNTTYSSYKIDAEMSALENDIQRYVDTVLAGLNKLSKEVIDDKTLVVKENVLYLYKDPTDMNNDYMQMMLINGAVVELGSTTCNMSGYYTNTEVDDKFALKIDLDVLTTSFNNLVTSVEKKIDKDKIVTVLDDTVTDEQVASAKAVYDKLSDLPTDSGSKCYTTLNELGLTADATFQDVIDTLPKGGSALLGVKNFTNYQTIFPYEDGNDQFARVYIVKGIADGSCMYARWFRKDGAKEAIANFNINGNNFNGWQMLKNKQVYTSIKELGLDTTATINDIIGAMKDGTTFTYKTDVFDYANEYNNLQYGTVSINKQSGARIQALMTDKTTGDLYVGKLDSTNRIIAWQKTISENSWTDPYSCSGYKRLTGTEDLFTLGTGHYVTEKADTAYNYPITDTSTLTAHIYVLGHLNDKENNKGYRIILYFDNKNRMYRINEWWGVFTDNGWQNMQPIGNGGNSDVYSTSEQAIGTWVDGKTIYRKTIVKDSHSANAQLISGVDTFIRGYGTCERAGYVYNVPHCGLLAGHLQDEDIPYLNFKLDTSGALSTIGSGTYTISKLKVTLEYTKK